MPSKNYDIKPQPVEARTFIYKLATCLFNDNCYVFSSRTNNNDACSMSTLKIS